MAAQFNEYTHGVLQINGTGAANTIRIENPVENPDATMLRKIARGDVQPSFAATMKLDPKITCETQEVGKVLDLMVSSGAIKGVLITTKATLYWQKKDELDRSSGADNLVTDINEGIVVPRTLRWNGENDVWMLGLEVLAAWDGTNNPFVYGTASAPAFTAFTEAYIGGKWIVNAVEQDCWQSCTLDFGLRTSQRHCKGGMYPGRAQVDDAEPFIEAPTLDLTTRSTYTLNGTIITQSDLYLRQSNGPNRISDVTLDHISLKSYDGIINQTQASGVNPSQSTLRVILNKTATKPPVEYANGVAIP